MRIARLVLSLIAALSSSAALADAPKTLYNKTIRLSWSEYRVQRADAGDVTRGSTASVLQVYVSDGGRLFTRLSRQNSRGRSNNSDTDPDGGKQNTGQGAGNISTSFEGQNLLIENQMRSGARRIQATFNAGFTGCNLRVIFGKDNGQDLYHKGMDGRMYRIISTDVSGTSCSIRPGNAFAS
ncbi:MAG: hypothetical protein A4S14_00640 [Proteobacteria bacterium SG_bin9]|nr:MAG: hypothetical protein A4S14_00640 [Proteobacteria bacterium SG_bin9]